MAKGVESFIEKESIGLDLVVKDVSKKLNGKWVIKNVNHTFRSETLTLLEGQNGSGKTSFLRLLGGVYRPDRGSLIFSDTNKTVRQNSIRIGFCGTSSYLYGDLTLLENLQLYLKLAGGSEGFLEKLVLDFKLQAFLGQPLRQCSTGVQKKASIVRSVIGLPTLIIFDEPLAFLDDEGCSAFLDLLRGLSGLGKIVVVSSNQGNIFRSEGISFFPSSIKDGEFFVEDF